MSRAAKMRIRRRQIQRNRRVALACCILIIFFASGSILFHNFHAQAKKTVGNKYYTDIRVQSGQTLWDIAMEYMTDEYDSPSEYIREVQKINHVGEQLQYGQYLTVPYYL